MQAEGAPRTAPSFSLLWATVTRLSLLIGLERRILAIIASYALAIGLFALIVPLTVQELVNTFAFAIQPIMILTLAGIMMLALLFMGAFRVLQARAVEVLVQRLFTRIAVAMTEQLPRFSEETFQPRFVNYFMEAELLPRAVVAMLVDIVNVLVSGTFGMTILVMYHPYFLGYNILLLAGFGSVVTLFGQGGFRITQTVSRLNYQMFDWLQDIAHNRLHFKATESMPLLLEKTDALARDYVMARRTRSDILTGRQYKSSVIWQAFGHSAMIALGGWLLSVGDITLGQFVAAEVIVGTLLLNLDTVARRLYAAIYVFTSMHELATLFALPKQEMTAALSVRLPDPTIHGVRVSCWEVSATAPDGSVLFENVILEIAPGEKIAVICRTNLAKTTFAMVLAGLYTPSTGVVRYNDADLRDVGPEYVNRCRGLVLDSHVSLFQGTIEENVSLRRPQVRFDDLRWALQFTELEEEIDAMPQGLDTLVGARGRLLTRSQILRLLVARAIAMRPQFLVFDGSLHDVEPDIRTTVLRRLCSKEEPWSLVFVSNDPGVGAFVERRVAVD